MAGSQGIRAEGDVAGSADAPIILWDRIHAAGTVERLFHISLGAQVFTPQRDGSVVEAPRIVAHLRMTGAALQQLKDAIGKMELLAQPAAGGQKN